MTHIHIPDGVLPWWLWGAGWLLTIAVLWLASRTVDESRMAAKVPLVGMVSALVLVAMSVELVPIAYHLNLTVVAGVLLGPWMGVVAAFVVATILALLGHGGITVIGLNTLLLGTEIALGWLMFRTLTKLLGRARIRWSGALATVLTLAVTTGLLVGIVAIAGAENVEQGTGALDPVELTFEDPFAGGLFGGRADEHGHEGHGGESAEEHADEDHEHADEADDEHADEDHEHADEAADEHADEDHEHADEDHAHEHGPSLSAGRFAAVVFILGPIGWALEAVVTAMVLGYVARLRPAMVFGGPVGRRPPTGGDHGDHHGEV